MYYAKIILRGTRDLLNCKLCLTVLCLDLGIWRAAKGGLNSAEQETSVTLMTHVRQVFDYSRAPKILVYLNLWLRSMHLFSGSVVGSTCGHKSTSSTSPSIVIFEMKRRDKHGRRSVASEKNEDRELLLLLFLLLLCVVSISAGHVYVNV